MATQLDQAHFVGGTRLLEKDVRVEIIADTVLNQNGRGIPIFKGSVLDVPAQDAGMLLASVKAKKVGPEVAIKIVPNPNAALAAAKKAS